MNDDLETADISTRVHNTRPHQDRIYSPIGRNNSGPKLCANDNSVVHTNTCEDDTNFHNSGKTMIHVKEKVPQHGEGDVGVGQVEKTPLEKAQKLFHKASKKFVVFDREDQAKLIVNLLIKLRQQYTLDEEVLSESLRWGLLQMLLGNADKIYKHSNLMEEALNCVQPIVISPVLKDKALPILMKSGGLIFSMTAIRVFHRSSASIRLQAVELLTHLLGFVETCNKSPTPLSSALKQCTSKSYVVHHLLLHGAASSLPALLDAFLRSSSEISVRRVLTCLTFLLTETPSDMAVTVAMNNRWAMLRDLLQVLRIMGPEAKRQAAVLMTGLVASSAVVAEKLIEMQAWDDLSTALVSPDLDVSCESGVALLLVDVFAMP